MRSSIRPRRLLQLLALLAAAALFAAACGGDDDESSEPAAPEPTAAEPAAAPEPEPEPAPEPYRVALLIPGTSDDASWSNAWADGAAAADAGTDDVDVEIVEALPEVDDFIQQGGAFAGDGYDLILMADGRMVDAARTVAEQFPDTVVCQIPHQPESTDGNPDNLCYVDVAQHHANFFTGAIAALVTDTGRVASINGFAFPGLTRQPETFNLGARCVNPDIEFSQQYINTWTDTAAAKAAAQAEIAAGADVIMAATDQAVLGVISAAQEAAGTVWVIPSYYDSFEVAPDVVLTSAVHGLQDVAAALIAQGLNGQIPAAAFIDFTAQNTPGISAAPLYDNASALDAESKAVFDDLEARVRSGEITIPDETAGDNPVGVEGAGGEIDLAAIGCG